jgi:hypothetical protein
MRPLPQERESWDEEFEAERPQYAVEGEFGFADKDED